MFLPKKASSLLAMLASLTGLAVIGQLSLFFLHFKTSSLLDSLIQSSLASQIWRPIILLPILEFILIQIASCLLFIAGIWFLGVSCGNFFNFSRNKTYWLGICTWVIACFAVLSFNCLYFSNSFFSDLLIHTGWYNHYYYKIIFIICASTLCLMTIIAYLNFIFKKLHRFIGTIFLFLGFLSAGFAFYTHFFTHASPIIKNSQYPNIIIIGLDSVRPDFVSYFNNQYSQTPNIDNFLKSSTIYTQAYTPLARTFPAWVSILTSQYPKHNHARSNLADPSLILQNDNLAKRLRQAGYETIYGTDEKRFSNITQEYGFDHIIGPHMGINDFILGGLSDLPLTNILINTPLGRFLFPYNFGNRAAAITYEPNSFLQLVQLSLARKYNKPVFLAIHLCVSHWPFTWAHDGQKDDFRLDQRYQSSVNKVDEQLGKLLLILKNDGLLENTLVVLLSDHGATLGLPGDRLTEEKNYLGDKEKMKWLPTFRITIPLETLNLKPVPQRRLDTSYGQGTDILSLKQYHILLAFKGYGVNIQKQSIENPSSLLDIAPTILNYLNLSPIKNSDGFILGETKPNKPIFLETGYSISEIETDKISVAKVIKKSSDTYKINPNNGLLYVNPLAEKAILKNKQRAILFNNWLLAKYPENISQKLTPKPDAPGRLTLVSNKIPSFYVLINLNDRQWTTDLTSTLAKKAPIKELLERFNNFYSDETNKE